MSDINQRNFVLENRARVTGPIVEIGSRYYGGSMQNNFRPDFPGLSYVGIDLTRGKGVDLVCDLTGDIQWFGSRFQTAICLSVMEHCAQPFKMAENITRLLDPEAVLFLSVPFVWRIHGFPDDYWRFTPAAIRLLFPAFTVDETASYCTSKGQGNKFPLKLKSLSPPPIPGSTYSLYPQLLNMLLVKRA